MLDGARPVTMEEVGLGADLHTGPARGASRGSRPMSDGGSWTKGPKVVPQGPVVGRLAGMSLFICGAAMSAA